MKHPACSTSFTSRSSLPVSERGGTVALFGEVLADIFTDRSVLGGAPFNVARHLRAFSQNPVLITRLGNDPLRDLVLNVMSQNEMDISGIQCNNRYPTGRVNVHMEDGSHRFEILPMQAYDFINPAVVRMAAIAAHPALVYFGTLAQRNDISRRALKTLLRSTSAERFLDINLRTPWYDEEILQQSLHYADTVKLNSDELYILAEMFGLSGSEPDQQAQGLMCRFDLRCIVITRGEAGAYYLNRDGKKVEAAVKKGISGLVDTVGAGDGFAAVYILGMLKQWPIPTILERANEFAAAICAIRGAVPDDAGFYKPYTRAWDL